MTTVSANVTLQPGQDTYTVAGTNFRATCPSGTNVIGTGFNTGIGNADFVIDYGSFVGGFVDNDTSVTIDQVHVQAICASVPENASANVARRAELANARYEADLLAAAHAARHP